MAARPTIYDIASLKYFSGLRPRSRREANANPWTPALIRLGPGLRAAALRVRYPSPNVSIGPSSVDEHHILYRSRVVQHCLLPDSGGPGRAILRPPTIDLTLGHSLLCCRNQLHVVSIRCATHFCRCPAQRVTRRHFANIADRHQNA
jgi:hypothetical protein